VRAARKPLLEVGGDPAQRRRGQLPPQSWGGTRADPIFCAHRRSPLARATKFIPANPTLCGGPRPVVSTDFGRPNSFVALCFDESRPDGGSRVGVRGEEFPGMTGWGKPKLPLATARQCVDEIHRRPRPELTRFWRGSSAGVNNSSAIKGRQARPSNSAHSPSERNDRGGRSAQNRRMPRHGDLTFPFSRSSGKAVELLPAHRPKQM